MAHLEDLRDEKLCYIVTAFQSRIRSFLFKKDLRRREEQRLGLVVVQYNIRLWILLRNWEWFKLYAKVRPMCKAGKIQEEMDKLKAKIKVGLRSRKEVGKMMTG